MIGRAAEKPGRSLVRSFAGWTSILCDINGSEYCLTGLPFLDLE